MIRCSILCFSAPGTGDNRLVQPHPLGIQLSRVTGSEAERLYSRSLAFGYWGSVQTKDLLSWTDIKELLKPGVLVQGFSRGIGVGESLRLRFLGKEVGGGLRQVMDWTQVGANPGAR